MNIVAFVSSIIARYAPQELVTFLAVLGTPLVIYIIVVIAREKIKDLKMPKFTVEEETRIELDQLFTHSCTTAEQIADLFGGIYQDKLTFTKVNMEIDIFIARVVLYLFDLKKHTKIKRIKLETERYLADYTNTKLYGNTLTLEQKDICRNYIIKKYRGYLAHLNLTDTKATVTDRITRNLFDDWGYTKVMPSNTYKLNIDIVNDLL